MDKEIRDQVLKPMAPLTDEQKEHCPWYGVPIVGDCHDLQKIRETMILLLRAGRGEPEAISAMYAAYEGKPFVAFIGIIALLENLIENSGTFFECQHPECLAEKKTAEEEVLMQDQKYLAKGQHGGN